MEGRYREKIKREGKKEVFDDIEKNLDWGKMVFVHKKFEELKQKHLGS